MNSILKFIVFSILASCLALAQAKEPGAESDAENAVAKQMFKFGGFGTLGVSHSSQRLGDYVPDSTFSKGPGLSSDWAASNDSRIGVQMTAKLTPEISAVVQVVSEYEADSNYRPALEWANVKYAFTPDAYIRVGRIALPTFLYSDSREVGYSYPWIHPPIDLYRQLPMNNSDGMDASYRFEVGEAVNSIKIIYGKGETERPTSVSTAKRLWGIFDTFEYGQVLLRAGYQIRDTSNLNLTTGVSTDWTHNTNLSLGASYDAGDWFAISEWTQHKSTTKLDAMYLSAGYRIKLYTPYLSYSQNGQASFRPGFPQATASAIQNAKRSESTVSLGVRWDFMKKADIKLQLDRVQLGDDSNGYLINVPTGVNLYGTRFHVISTVLDFVF
jgi:hypothetical protein